MPAKLGNSTSALLGKIRSALTQSDDRSTGIKRYLSVSSEYNCSQQIVQPSSLIRRIRLCCKSLLYRFNDCILVRYIWYYTAYFFRNSKTEIGNGKYNTILVGEVLDKDAANVIARMILNIVEELGYA